MKNAKEYLIRVLNWKQWVQHHKKLVEAIKEVLAENEKLKSQLDAKCENPELLESEGKE